MSEINFKQINKLKYRITTTIQFLRFLKRILLDINQNRY